MELEASQSYANFRAWCPRKEVSVGVLHPIPWRYYDWGPKSYPEPLICLHSLIGSAESFFHQIVSLAPRGYRIISVQIPVYWSVAEFCDAFHAFLETIPHRRLHLYGAGLGGFLAMHYAVRKPERIASLILTHSFLSTENLNLRIPYSSAFLRWLPEFLVRATMSAILPKGRVSLDMANAAELAIGHTMACSRDVLASRMALSVTKSTVVNRVHLPETSITLIDALDRQSSAVELSERTASYFPNARRALLKRGGDFPYLAVPDDVNVHLIVHMRRHGVDPVPDVPIPVPARPMKLPESSLRRRAEEARRAMDDKNSDKTGSESVIKQSQTRPSEELQSVARAVVAADERSKIERYAFEIGRLREFLPGRHDEYLASVLDVCEGNLELAISNALEEQYDDEFYETLLTRAIERAVANIRVAEEEPVIGDTITQETENVVIEGDESTSSGSVDEANEAIAVQPENSLPATMTSVSPDEDIVSVYRRRGVLNQDPLGETEFFEDDKLARDPGEKVFGSDDMENSTADRDSFTALSPEPKAAEHDSQDGGMRIDPVFGQHARGSPSSAMSIVDLGGNDACAAPENTNPPTRESAIDRDETRSVVDPASSERRQHRIRRKSYPQEADAVGAYVSSERVGMRSKGPLVGRGPAPFDSAPLEAGLSTGEGWMKSPRLEENEDAARFEVDDKTQISLSSGASLLENDENPLVLPGHEKEYGERTLYKMQTTPEHERRVGRKKLGTRSVGGTPTLLEREAGVVRSSPLYTSNSGVGMDRSAIGIGGEGTAEEDEWERFRGEERGLAGVISTPVRPIEKALEQAFDDLGTAGPGESEEAARLREWRMSAQAASKSVHR